MSEVNKAITLQQAMTLYDDLRDRQEALVKSYEQLTFPVNKGTLCLVGKSLRVAKQNIPTSEVYTPAHWEAADISEELTDVKSGINGKYTKPSGGIPDTDLSSGVQSSLEKADSAYQIPSDGIPDTDLATTVQTSLGLADTAYQKPQSGIPASDLASGVIKNWELICDYTVPQNVASVEITTDTNGRSFELDSMYVRASLEIPTTGSNDYVSSSVIYKDNNDVIKTQQTVSLRYNSGTAKSYFDYFVNMIYRFWMMLAKAGNAFGNSQNAQMSSFYNYDSPVTVSTICGFKLSQYNSSSTLIPQGTNIKIYGIRK